MVTGQSNITIAIKYEVIYGFDLAYLDLTLAYSEGQLGRRNGVNKIFGFPVYSRHCD